MSGNPKSAVARPIKVVAMGGGTGLSTLLHGLKQHVVLPGESSYDRALPFISELSAVVTVSDDGGSSGRLRKELNVPPPGDIRNCIVALAEKEALLSRLFQYRFKAGEGLEGHSFGNLFLSAMTDITGDFSEAVQYAAAILATRGHIHPATTSNAQLYAIMDDGCVVRGETNITASRRRIVELRMAPVNAKPAPAALRAIEEADLITIGPGSLFTSLVPNLLVRDLSKAIKNSRATKVYVCNLMTQANESLDLTASQHIQAIYAHARHEFFDYALVNQTPASPTMRKKYDEKQQSQIVVDADRVQALGVKPILGDYLAEELDPNEGLIARHETHRVAHDLLRLMIEAHPAPVATSLRRERRSLDTLRNMNNPKSVPDMTRTAAPAGFAIVILAAGKGTRLKSRHPKVLHQIAGKTLLAHVVAAASRIVRPEEIFAIIGHEADKVRAALQSTGIGFVEQKEQRGTGHAVMQAREALRGYEHVLVLSGDVPFIHPETIERVRSFHVEHGAAMTVLTAEPQDPTGYGRVFRKYKDLKPTEEVDRIVEQKALRNNEGEQREINSGIYAFAAGPLFANIDKLTTENPAGEFYLTDMAGLLGRAGHKVVALKASDSSEVLGANTRAELAELDIALRAKKARELMAAGTTIFRPDTCDIDADVEVGTDTVIEPFVQIIGKTKIGSDCRIRSYSVITNCQIGDKVLIRPGCIMEDSVVGDGAQLGPYSHLRPGSDIGEGAHVGNFVETKKTRLGKGSKANHLSYLGDAVIGEGVNIGAGTITCNYDGVNKHQSVIEDGVFVGSDSTLVAPVKLGKGAYVGAGSCITDEVPADALALGRSRQVNKPNWACEKREKMKAAKKS